MARRAPSPPLFTQRDLLVLLALGVAMLGLVLYARRPAPPPPPLASVEPLYPADLRVPDSEYPIPSGALHVAPYGNDRWRGSARRPLRTVQRAVDLAADGDTIVVHQGVYREQVNIWNKSLTLQAAPHEQVWIKGSDIITGWVQDGSVWRKDGWTHLFEPATPILEDPAYPMAKYPDLLFIDGRPLTQVASPAEVRPGTFLVDVRAQQLVIGDDPTGHVVEAGVRQNALLITNTRDVTVRGIGFMHAASNATDGSGAVFAGYDVQNILLEGNVFAWNAAMGVEFGEGATDTQIRDNHAIYNGCAGVSGWGVGHGAVIERNWIAFNNQERFSGDWGCAGVKVVQQRGMLWRDNIVEHNLGTGLWCDISCFDVTIVRNLVRENAIYGIFLELSATSIIASNIVTGHAEAGGIYVSESSDVQVYSNTLVDNLRGINVQDADRINTDPEELALGITWFTRNVAVKNNLVSQGGTSPEHIFGVIDHTGVRTAESMLSAVDYNGYYRRSSSIAGSLGRWLLPGGKDVYYYTLDDMTRATGQERHGLAVEDVETNPFFIDERGDYRLTPDSPARDRGQPLPLDVAAAIGVPAGTPVDLGALRWPSGR